MKKTCCQIASLVIGLFFCAVSISPLYGQSTADIKTGKIKYSLVKWSFRTQTSLLCMQAKELGVDGVEMVDQEKWDTVLNRGLAVAVADGADLGIERGFCNAEWHKDLQESYIKIIPVLRNKGIKQVVCYSGLNTGLSKGKALDICAEGLKPLVKLAEQNGVILTMELLSSRESKEPYVKHQFQDYQCDNVEWGVELCKRLNSPNFRLLYDIWHMNDMGRDIIGDIKKYHNYFSHYQIAGIPSRGVIKGKDPFNYREVIAAIESTGYNGFVGIEPDRIEKDIRNAIKECMEVLSAK